MTFQICVTASLVQNLAYTCIGLCVLSYTYLPFTAIDLCVYIFTYSSQHSNEHLPDIVWCREPFFEELNYIEAFNDINN